MTDMPDLEPLKNAVSLVNTAVSELMKIPPVKGVCIAVRMDEDYYCDLKTRAGCIKKHYNLDDIRAIAEEAYCSVCCCADEPFSADSCAECSLYEFLKIIEEDGKELDLLKREEEE